MILSKLVLRFFMLCVAISQVFAQTATPASSQQVRLIATAKTSTFEKELNDAAKEGFRLTRLAKAVYAGSVSGILTRQQNSSPGYEYKVMATTRLSTMKTELEQAAAEGYEFRGVTTENNSLSFTSKETIVVMERPVGETKQRFEYKLVTAKKTQEDLDAASAEGFAPVELFVTENLGIKSTFSFSSSSILLNFIFSRDVNKPAVASDYRVIWKADPTKMQNEMNQLAKEGFRLDLVAAYSLALMSRPKQSQSQKFEYAVLAEARKNPLLKQITEIGALGYRFRGASFVFEVSAFMEREVGANSASNQIEYRMVKTIRESTTKKEFEDAVAAGFVAEDFLSSSQNLLVFSKSVAKPEAK